MAEFDSDADIFDRTRGGPNSERGSKALEPLLREREQGARTSEPCENCITSGSPLCRGLTRATYILCIEHPRPKRLSQESYLGPPALQAKSHSNDVIICFSEPRLVLLQGYVFIQRVMGGGGWGDRRP